MPREAQADLIRARRRARVVPCRPWGFIVANLVASAVRHRETVLFVDASTDTLDSYMAVASADGFCVELANDAREAFALANLVHPDVIVLEIADRDALETLDSLRRGARTGSVPIIAVTSGADADLNAQAERCTAHVRKPLVHAELLRLLRFLAIARARPARRGP